jgi:hypothetical protein
MFHLSCGLSVDLYFFGIKFQCFTLESYCRLLPLTTAHFLPSPLEYDLVRTQKKNWIFDLRVQERVRATSQISSGSVFSPESSS